MVLKSFYCIKNNKKEFYFCNKCEKCCFVENFFFTSSIYIRTQFIIQYVFYFFYLFEKNPKNIYLHRIVGDLNEIYYTLLLEINLDDSSSEKISDVDFKTIYKYKIQLSHINQYSHQEKEKLLKEQISFLKMHLDILESYLNRKISINMIKKIQSFFYQTKMDDESQRILIINGIDNIRLDSGNLFLKFLEEPPKNLWVILITNHIYNVMKTIRSRAMHVIFKPIPDIKIFSKILSKNILKNISDSTLSYIQDLKELPYQGYSIKYLCILVKSILQKNEKNWIFSFIKDISINLKDNKNQTILHVLKLWIIFFQEIESMKNQKSFFLLKTVFRKRKLLSYFFLEREVINEYCKLRDVEIYKIRKEIVSFKKGIEEFSLNWKYILTRGIFSIRRIIKGSIEG